MSLCRHPILVVALLLSLSPILRAGESVPAAAAEHHPFAVAIYCASSRGAADEVRSATRIGEGIGDRHWTLVWGGADAGLMGTVARGAKARGGRLVGVMADMFKSTAFPGADQLVFAPTVAAAKAGLQERADAFVVLPGGCGTMDEFFNVLELKQLALHHKPVILFNQDGYYDPLVRFIDESVRRGFTNASVRRNLVVVTTVDALFAELTRAAGGS
ncbi:MAG TPA: TIGR00730 family Rossman fold protein [Opitutaceae bacterium]|nr:TIGR00730 family Rossman fold protein [Opitutaceae bacterium]